MMVFEMAKGLLITATMLFVTAMLIGGLFLMHYTYHYLKVGEVSAIKILAIALPLGALHSAVMGAVLLFVKWKIDEMDASEQ